MLNEMIEKILKSVKDEYPHIETPAAMKAVVTSAIRTNEKYKAEVTLIEKDSGSQKEYELEQNYYVYSVKIVDNAGSVLEGYPIIPNIKSKEKFEAGSVVTVIFIGGELCPAIVGG